MSGTLFLAPPWIPPLAAGETDGRYIDCTPDLGPVNDTFPSINVLSVAISRQDGAATTSNDLQSAGAAWPNTLDPTGLIPTFGFIAPIESAGVVYIIKLTANTTTQGRLFIRSCYLKVLALMG